MRRGRFAGERYYRTEKERLEAEKAQKESIKSGLNFEEIMQNYPSKFNVADCMSHERTYPACKSSVKVPIELESFVAIERDRINPRAHRGS